MERTIQDAYLSLDLHLQALVLVTLAHDVTIVSRGFYSAYPDEQFKRRVRGFNEVTNRLTSHARDLLAGSPTYPEPVFLNIFSETAERNGLRETLFVNFERAVTRLSRSS